MVIIQKSDYLQVRVQPTIIIMSVVQQLFIYKSMMKFLYIIVVHYFMAQMLLLHITSFVVI